MKNPVAKDLRTPKYKPRIVRNKKSIYSQIQAQGKPQWLRKRIHIYQM